MEVSAYFSPGEDCLDALRDAIAQAQTELLICVFTISDDRIASSLLQRRKDRLRIQLIADNDKMHDKGSDVLRLFRSGIQVRTDVSPHHMHHKFMVVDRKVVLTGSYNWTRSAERYNRENLVRIDEPELAASFAREFERIWKESAPPTPRVYHRK